MASQSASLKRFLLQNLYRHPQVSQTSVAARQIVRDLFDAYLNDPTQMAVDSVDRSSAIVPPATAGKRPERKVADHIACMTDRFAAKEHERLKGHAVFPV